MRIALELQPCCGNRSGIGNYTYELVRRLKNDKELSFHGNLFNFCHRNDNVQSLRGLDIPVQESCILPYGLYRRIWDWFPVSYQRLFPKEADLHIFFNYIVPPRMEGPVITTIYDCTHLRFPETMERRNRRRIRQGLNNSIRRSCHFLTISEFSKQEMIELLGIPAEQISVVYSAPSDTGGYADFNALSIKLDLKKPYLLYVGTIEPRKNLERLLRAFGRLKPEIPHQLVLAGGDGWNNQRIHEVANRIPGADAVRFTGYLSDAERNSLYQNADLFVFPSLYEGFGMPPLEAMRFGCPVVCSNAASLPEVVGDAAELVNPIDEENITEGIWKLLTDPKYAAELVWRGYRQSQKFTWESSADRFLKVCENVLEEAWTTHR